jgi:hypothetical protein
MEVGSRQQRIVEILKRATAQILEQADPAARD